MLKKFIHNKKYIEIGLITLVIGVALLVAYELVSNGTTVFRVLWRLFIQFLKVISPILYAFVVAYILYIPMKGIERFHTKILGRGEVSEKKRGMIRLLSVASTFILVLLAVITIIKYLLPDIITNVEALLKSIPQLEKNIGIWLNQFNDILGSLPLDVSYRNTLIQQLGGILQFIGETLINIVLRLFNNLSSFVVDFVITIILSFYFLKDKEKLFNAVGKFTDLVFPVKIKKALQILLQDVNEVVGGFLLGTILSCVVVGIVSTVLMLLIGHPFAIMIGVIAGLTNVIPYIGPIIGALLAFILGLFNSFKFGVLAAALLILYQQIDGNIIQPKIVGDKVGVAPVWILMAVLIGGSYFGGLGMIISVPIAALVNVYLQRLYKLNKEKKLEKMGAK